jgi:hypothetical protein
MAQRIAGQLLQATAILDHRIGPPHAAVVVPAVTPLAWRSAATIAAKVALDSGGLVLVRPPVAGLRALRASYYRGVADVGLALAAHCADPIVMPHELVIPRMLASADAQEQAALLAPLRPILELAPAQREMYLRTLDVLRRTGGTHADVAAQLHLHVNSVRYRLDRIEEITGQRLSDPIDRLALDLALILVGLREHARPPGVDADFGLRLMRRRGVRGWAATVRQHQGRGAGAITRGPRRPEATSNIAVAASRA